MAVRRRSPVLLMCVGLTVYFGFHAAQGKHGLEARTLLQSRSFKLGEELRALEVVRRGLEREVALLSETAPDPDFIEELARGILGYARRGDVILIGASRPAAIR